MHAGNIPEGFEGAQTPKREQLFRRKSFVRWNSIERLEESPPQQNFTVFDDVHLRKNKNLLRTLCTSRRTIHVDAPTSTLLPASPPLCPRPPSLGLLRSSCRNGRGSWPQPAWLPCSFRRYTGISTSSRADSEFLVGLNHPHSRPRPPPLAVSPLLRLMGVP